MEQNSRHVMAEVSGSEDESYLVELDFSEDGEVEDWSCDCPYDWGDVCKHTAAVLLAVQETDKGRAYLEQNLEIDEFRLILVREYIAKGDYAQAEFLCQERLEKECADQAGP